eukprot:TRINITY_DN7107_c0_g1_i1.p1 TRINITY_DN7107_c0_g1~~TRINITY_DN7107_c0_g1_i1.p1  ORF type:complete len:514 (-),score=65.43 TRINITY_DN7107_c0_g1_i1:391-1911(-)
MHQVGGTTYFYNGNGSRNKQSDQQSQQRHSGAYAGTQQSFHQPYPNYSFPSQETDAFVPPPFPTAYSTPTPPPAPPPATQTPYHAASELFMSNSLRDELLRKAQLMLPSVETAPVGNTPRRIGHFHSLQALDAQSRPAYKGRRASLFGSLITQVYKCTSDTSGMVCVIHRVVDPPQSAVLLFEAAPVLLGTWAKLSHPNVVAMHNVFLTTELGTQDLLFEFSYIPGALTFEEAFLTNAGNGPTEAELWKIICQIVSALKSIHELGLAARSIIPSKLLISSGNRVHLNCAGMLDLLAPLDSSVSIEQLQYEDIVSLGSLLLSVACRTRGVITPELLQSQRQYSPALQSFLSLLASTPPATITELGPYLASRLLDEVANSTVQTDAIEAELQKELHNGRMARLLIRLGFINERPEYESDPAWSDTGDRYILKLFRDYVFHQSDETGAPRVDWGHVISTLNKLDAGSEEKVALASRDGANLLVVSFKDLKRLVGESFSDLLSRGRQHGS